MTNVVVKNTSAFTGGQDAQPNSVIEQKDIDGAASGAGTPLKQGVLASLQGQVRSQERVVPNSQQCPAQVNADHRAGDVARSVTVTVAVTCSETVYDYDAARQVAEQTLAQKVAGDPTLGASYALSGQVTFNVLNSAQTNGFYTLNGQAEGLWVYRIDPATLHRLAASLAGKSESDARALLLRQPGIAAVSFSASGTLPVNSSEISLVLAQPPGGP